MEQVYHKEREEEVVWNGSMGGEEAEDLGLSTVEDAEVELDSGFCMEADSELGLIETTGSDEELDWTEITEVIVSNRTEEIWGWTSEDAGSQTEDNDDNGETDEQIKAVTGGAVDVCLSPAEETASHVRISLEEVEKYYRFSRCCHWLGGRFQIYNYCLTTVFKGKIFLGFLVPPVSASNEQRNIICVLCASSENRL